ncbi:MAG: hypothetical protein ACXIUV_15165 [Alkalilacustris sp.]
MLRLAGTLILVAVLAAAGGLALGGGVLQDRPAAAPLAPPAPEDVRAAQDVYRQVQAVTDAAPDAPDTVILSEATLQSLLRVAGRLGPSPRAGTGIAAGQVWLTAALPVRWPGGQRWLNLHVVVAPFADGFAFETVRLGAQAVPPGPALRLARAAGNLAMGDRLGDALFDALAALSIDGDRITLRLDLDRDGRREMAQGVFGALRGADLPAPERVRHHHARLIEALETGAVPTRGSLLPLLRVALSEALAATEADPGAAAEDFAAAFFALARLCGAREFLRHVGYGPQALSDRADAGACAGLTLAGRTDLREHFVTSAAIKAASNSGFAVSVGEFKELHDAIPGASGFDFTDIAGNQAGIRLVDLFMGQPPATWPGLIARLTDEAAFFPDLADIPRAMSRTSFEARFGTIDSPAYRAMLARIDARIDRTALHAGSRGDGG